jgi:hypothetical protein
MGFQTGSQIRPELGNADYSGFANAANIRANALANLGEQIGGAIESYGIKKEKKANQKLRYESILPYTTQQFGAEEGEKMAQQFALDPALTSQVMQFATIQKDQEVLDKALAVSTNTDGTTDWGQTVQSYIELGGSDPRMVAGLASEARKSDPKEAFTPSVMEVDGVTFAITSKGGAQVISTPDGGEMKLPAGAQVSEYKVKQLQKAREAYISGDINASQDIITGLGLQDKITNSPFTPEEIFPGVTPEGVPEVVTPDGTTVGDEEESLQDIIARNLTPNQ